MTDILELADANLEYINDLEGSVYFVTKEEMIYFASLLREKFIADIGEPVNEVYEFERWITGNTLIRTNLGIDLNYADPLAEVAYRAWKARAKLYTSPQQREWKDIDLSEYESQGLGVIAEEICTKLKQLNAEKG